MARDVRRPRLSSHHDRKSTSPRESDEEELDELVTTPATSNNGANDSDHEMDKTRLSASHASSSHGSLDSAEEALVRVVRAGLDAEQLKVIEGVRHHLGDERARQLEKRALQELDNFVADEIQNNPGREPLRKVYVSLKTWTANHNIPLTPISKNTIIIYAHGIFTVEGAVWKLEHRKIMLDMLESLRTCANKRYRRDLEGAPVYREAFLESIYDCPAAKGLETVDRDLTVEENESEPEDEELNGTSSDEEVAQQLTGPQPRGSASIATPPTPTSISPSSVMPELEVASTATVNKRKCTATSSSNTAGKAKRQKTQPSPARPPSPVTAQNTTSTTDSTLSGALGFKRSPRAPLSSLSTAAQAVDNVSVSGEEASLSVPVKTGQAVRPSSPSAWAPSPSSKQESSATAVGTAPIGKPGRPPPQVIDLCSDTSDEEGMEVDKPTSAVTTSTTTTDYTVLSAPAEQANVVPAEQAHVVPVEQANVDPVEQDSAQASGTTSTNTAASLSASVQRKPRPPLYPPSVAARLREIEADSASNAPASSIQTVPAAVPLLQAPKDVAPATLAEATAPLIGTIKVPANAAEAPSHAIPTVHQPVQAFNQAVREFKKSFAAKKTIDSHDTPPGVLTPPVVNGLTVSPDVDMATESISTGKSVDSVDGPASKSAEHPRESLPTPVVESVPSVAAPDQSVPSANTQSLGEKVAPEATNCVQTGLSSKPSAEVDSGLRPGPSRVPKAADPLFDNWDTTFKELAQAVFKALEREKPNDALLQVNNKVLEFQMGHDQRVSAEFGWIRNQRRAKRQSQASAAAGSQAQQSEHWSRPNLKTQARSRTTSAHVGASLQPSSSQWLAGTESSSVKPSTNTAPVPAIQVLSTSDQILASVRQQGTQQAASHPQRPSQPLPNAHLLKLIYPDFLRDIRKPTLVTGLLPVYLGPDRPMPARSYPLPTPPQVYASTLNAPGAVTSLPPTTEGANVANMPSLRQNQSLTTTPNQSPISNPPLFPLQHAPANYISTISAQAGPSRQAARTSTNNAPVQRNPAPHLSAQWQASPVTNAQPVGDGPSRFTDITSPPQPLIPLAVGNLHTRQPHSAPPVAVATSANHAATTGQATVPIQAPAPQGSIDASQGAPSSMTHAGAGSSQPPSSTGGQSVTAFAASRPRSAIPVQAVTHETSEGRRETSIGLGIPAGPPRSAQATSTPSAPLGPTSVLPTVGNRRVSAPIASRSKPSQSPTIPVPGPMRRFSGYSPQITSLPQGTQQSFGQASSTTPQIDQLHTKRSPSPFRGYDSATGRFIPHLESSSLGPPPTSTFATSTTVRQAAESSAQATFRLRTSQSASVPATTANVPSQPTRHFYYGQSTQGSQSHPQYQQPQYQQGPYSNLSSFNANSSAHQPQMANQQHMADQQPSSQRPFQHVVWQQPGQSGMHQHLPLSNSHQYQQQQSHQYQPQQQQQYRQYQEPLHSQFHQGPLQQFQQGPAQQSHFSHSSMQQSQTPSQPSLEAVRNHWNNLQSQIQNQLQQAGKITQNQTQQQAASMPNQLQQTGMEGLALYQAPYTGQVGASQQQQHQYQQIQQHQQQLQHQPTQQVQQQQYQYQQQSMGVSTMQHVWYTSHAPVPPQQQPAPDSVAVAQALAPASVPAHTLAPAPAPAASTPTSQEIAQNPQDRPRQQLERVRSIAKHLGVKFETSTNSTSSTTTGLLSEAAVAADSGSAPSTELVHQRSGSTTVLHSNPEFGNMLETQELIEGIAKKAAMLSDLNAISKIAESMKTVGIEKTYINLFQFRAFYNLGELEKKRLEREEAERQRLVAQQGATPAPTLASALAPGAAPGTTEASQNLPPAPLPATSAAESGQSQSPTAAHVPGTAETSQGLPSVSPHVAPTAELGQGQILPSASTPVSGAAEVVQSQRATSAAVAAIDTTNTNNDNQTVPIQSLV